jgi:low temperature requirement protein LtrA
MLRSAGYIPIDHDFAARMAGGMTGLRWRDPDAAPADRVTAVETFFDIVFAFTLTQLTRTLEEDLSLAAAGRILLVFGPLWYMYGGYAWLTNHVPPRRASQKLVLFGAMAGFFIAALGIPHAFAGTAALFGVGYLVVICVHLALFTQADGDVIKGIFRLAPYNVGGALLILAASFVQGLVMYGLWVAGYLLMTAAPYLVPRYSWIGAAGTFHVSAEHFVERHGLLVMIALGESVIAIGMGVDVAHVTAASVGMIILALALPGAMWWTYFTDYHAAEHALAGIDTEARSMLAIRAYYFAHIPVLLGIVGAAAGIHAAIEHPGAPTQWRAATVLSCGVALFLVGMADFRRCMSIASASTRIAAAVAVLAAVPIGALASARLHLASLLGIVIVMLLVSPRNGTATRSSSRD